MAIENHPGFVLALIVALVGVGYVVERQQSNTAGSASGSSNGTPTIDQRAQLCVQQSGCYDSSTGTCWTKQTDGSYQGRTICLPGELCPYFVAYLPAGSAAPC